MESFKKNIEGIRNLMKDMKVEKYAIINPDLIEVDEYIKSLYIKVLCTVIQYQNYPSDMQVLFLKRIVCGMKLDDSVEDYMRKALEISDKDIQEFITIFTEQKYKYYFALDGLLLVSMGNGKGVNYEYLAELIELIDINKMDLEYISLIARSVLQQESSYYEQAKALINDRVSALDFAPYINSFYVGSIVDTDMEKHYFAPDKKCSSNMIYPNTYKTRNVIFENLIITITDDWLFDGCESVVFKNCELDSKNGRLEFSAVGKAVFENCKVTNFKNRFAYFKHLNSLDVCGCKFIECGYTCDGNERGGVFAVHNTNTPISQIKISQNRVLICYIGASKYISNYGVTGAFLGLSSYTSIKRIEVSDNVFNGCQCINNGSYKEAIIGGYIGGYTTAKVEKNNKCTGKLTRVLED